MAQFAVLPQFVQRILQSDCAYVYEDSYRTPGCPGRYLDVLELYAGVCRIASMASEACFACCLLLLLLRFMNSIVHIYVFFVRWASMLGQWTRAETLEMIF